MILLMPRRQAMAAPGNTSVELKDKQARNGHSKEGVETPEHFPEPEARAPVTAAPSRVEPAPPGPKGHGRSPLVNAAILGVVLVALTVATLYGIHYFRFASSHSGTDNATITNDVIQISPQVSGTVKQVLVKENEQVKAGDLLVVLDDATYRAAYDQAKANLDVAIAQAQGAGAGVQLTTETGTAQVLQAQGTVSQAEGGIASATADVARSAAGVSNARAAAAGARAGIGNAEAGVTAAISNKQRAADAINSAQAQLATAQAGVKAAQASVEAAQSVYEKASRDAARYEQLVKEGAVSEQMADAMRSTARQANAQLESARQQVASAQSTVAQRQAELNSAKQQLEGSSAAIAQARALLAAAKDQANAAAAGIKQAQAVEAASRQGVHVAEARRQQAEGQLNQAQTAPRQVAVSQSAVTQANAKIEQAKAALESAKILLDYTKIYAPSNGRISKKTVEVGALVQPGTPLMAIIPNHDVWVMANFKETQLAGVVPGRHAEVEVDAVPGHAFRGHVDSISAATGSTFALLPPDNATGNFTKVVQRIPVKIILEPNQADLDKLRAGMSATATVETKK
jgi:membrane fusion protein (multidrug efflux system)